MEQVQQLFEILKSDQRWHYGVWEYGVPLF